MATLQWTGIGFNDGDALTTSNSGGSAGDALTVTLVGSGGAFAEDTNPPFTSWRWARLVNPGGGGTDRARIHHAQTGMNRSGRAYFQVPVDPGATAVLMTCLDNSGSFSTVVTLALVSASGVRRLRLLDQASATLCDWGPITYGTASTNRYMIDMALLAATSTTGQYEVRIYDSTGAELTPTSGSRTGTTANLGTTGFARWSWGGSAGVALQLHVTGLRSNNDSPSALVGPGTAAVAPTVDPVTRPAPTPPGTVAGSFIFRSTTGTISSTSVTILSTPPDGGQPPNNPTVSKSDSGLSTGTVTTSWSFPAIAGRYTLRATCTDSSSLTATPVDLIIDVYPAAGGTVLPYRRISGSYTAVGTSSLYTAYTDSSDGTYGETGEAPTDAAEVWEWCAFPPPPTKIRFRPRHDNNPASPTVSVNLKVYQENGTTLVDEFNFTSSSSATTETLEVDTQGEALLNTAISRRALRTRHGATQTGQVPPSSAGQGSSTGAVQWQGAAFGVQPGGTVGTRTAIATSAPTYATGTSYYPVDANKTTLTGPKPTNQWFMNFMLGTGYQAVNVFPYELRVTATGLDFCVPNVFVPVSSAVLATMLQNLSFQATTSSTTQKLTAFTDLGCTVVWTLAGGTMTANIVRGMGYVTMAYSGVTPKLITQNAITAINGTAVGATGEFTGTKFKLTMNNGQTWIVYASSSITVNLSTANTLTATGTFTGTLRAALLPAGASESLFDTYATAIPTGGTVEYGVTGNTGTQTFTYTGTGGAPLMYCLPHHQDWLQSPTYPGPEITTLRGVMKAITGSTWTMIYVIPAISWDNAAPIAATRLAAVQAALDVDQTYVPAVGDPYFGGKQLAKAARLALIADQVGDTAARDTLISNLRTTLTSYLTGGQGAVLRYDTVWGGIVSQAGLTTDQADFGNGRYNDHHFHYGYAIYAAAVVARYDSAWATTNQARINDLIRNIANPSSTDPYYTVFRHFDFFEGHSWASGNYEFGDNRNQESTSEAVNAWYGVYLWGQATSQGNITTLGKMLFGQEVATAQRYWQIKSTSAIYPSPFKENGVVGVLWSNKCDYATFFGGQAEYIHGIQMIPTNPTTEALVPDDWITETWTNILWPLWSRTSVWRAELLNGGAGYVPAQYSPTGQGYTDGLVASGGSGSGLGFNVNITAGAIIGVYIIYNQHGSGYVNGETITLNGSGGTGATVRVWTQPEDGWKGILLGAYSQINASDAWTKAADLTSFDDGSSKTQVLAHIASQPGVG